MTQDMMTYEPQGTAHETPKDIEAFLLLDNPNDAYIFHEHSFGATLSWLEYDLETGRLDFIAEDGDLRNFGIPVSKDIGAYLQNIHSICVAHKSGGNVISEVDLPLITHRS
ncbi:MAG: hypothetical protein COB76_02775 [Alphaproteobacteria bacterium]|nr:MAG: hypothetical protein COB76_02775 [Alphaproteobacteria bacterium]